MAKKKMTPSQAASARRPDDYVPPKSAPAKKEKAKTDPFDAATDSGINKLMAPFVILFILAAIAAPFIVIGVSSLLGWN